MCPSMDKYKDIRPYHDDEVRPVLENILGNKECISAVTRLRFPRASQHFSALLNPLVIWGLRRQVRKVDSIADFQAVVEHYMTHMIKTTTSQFTVSGCEHLEPGKAYLFLSNHRDIALDPAFINYALFHQKQGTVRIAVGDNLLTKDYVSDLMRLNKSFIVQRSAKGPRQLFAALKKLSSYIRYSTMEENHSVWIAQREGRAKDGVDKSEPAIIKMLAMSGDKKASFADKISALHIVPVSISYEYDPCDVIKANELSELERTGNYEKGEQEDVASIALGISGQKGHVHVAFGEQLQGDYATAEDVADALDQQIVGNYVLHPSNYFAYKALYGNYPSGHYSHQKLVFNNELLKNEEQLFKERQVACPQENQRLFLEAYANPICSKRERGGDVKA